MQVQLAKRPLRLRFAKDDTKGPRSGQLFKLSGGLDGTVWKSKLVEVNAEGVLRPAADLTFHDAPWMSSTLRQRPDGGGVRPRVLGLRAERLPTLRALPAVLVASSGSSK